MAAFSRLQLAAALLEYDNDPDNPDAPQRSAHESAIFAHLRRTDGPRRQPDYLGVSIPSESGSLGGRESAIEGRKSRSSMDALRNPFGADDTVDGHDDEEEIEVDLASWGLDSFIPKDKRSGHSKKKSKAEALPNPRPLPSLRRRAETDSDDVHRRVRSMSLNYGNILGAEVNPSGGPSSTGAALDLAYTDPAHPQRQRRASYHGLIEHSHPSEPPHSIPFPTVSPRSESLALDGHRRYSDIDPKLRPYETARPTSGGFPDNDALNPFSVEPPSPSRASRFDPKHVRIMSTASVGIVEKGVRPSSRASRLDPAHARTISNGSLGSRVLLDNDGGSVMTGHGTYAQERRYSTLELLRPKVLVMPSPLQQVPVREPTPPPTARDGFELAVDGPPLPPGARTTRRGSATLSALVPSSVPIASNSFTPNPRTSLTLSQLTFRNTLMVGGQRDISYSDLDPVLPRATEDGEQIRPDSPIEELPEPTPVAHEEPGKPTRPAGKLFGKSLIDDLESRKTQLRNKKRVFVGDERPSMMARVQRSSTLIDPATLHAGPTAQNMNTSRSPPSQQLLGRKNSLSMKPLLSFDSEELPGANSAPNVRSGHPRSVFGVDTIWERETAKLREIEAREKIEEEESKKREEEEQRKKQKRREKRKGKSKRGDDEQREAARHVHDAPRVSTEPPVLPSIQKASAGRAPPVVDDDESDESVDSAEEARSLGPRSRLGAEAVAWHAGSSGEEDKGPRRTTGTGPRYPNAARPRVEEEDSEEDLPLSLAVGRAIQRTTGITALNQSSDEELPLSILLRKAKSSLQSSSSPRSPRLKQEASDDDEPLGLRASRAFPPSRVFSSSQDQDDDDKPLAFHPEQQRRTQYQMLAQHQQMMMQAQLHNSMFFGAPAMMGSGFFGQPMAAAMVVPPPPMPMPSPPPLQDTANFGRVDRWRRDVAVEGKP